MSVVDVVLLVLLLLSLLAGWRQGVIVGLASIVGLVGGAWVALWAVPQLVARVAPGGGRALMGVAAFVLIVLLAQALVVSAAAAVRRHVARGPGRVVDRVGGAVAGLLTMLAVVWLAAGVVRATPFAPLNALAARSQVVAAIDRHSPVASAGVVAGMRRLLDDQGFPQAFFGDTETIRPVPSPEAVEGQGVAAATAGVVKITAMAPRCNTGMEGSGFVAADGRVVTNAHVVAGSDGVAVQPRGVGGRYEARVVLFDPGRDLAVLDVPGLPTRPLALGQDLGTGAAGAAAGFPENGPLTLSPVRVREVVQARGTDIYGTGTTVREIYSLRGVVRPGNSGGPLLDTSGRVVGVVFARSASDADTGYALTMREAQPVLARAGSAATPVPTGSCAA